jgi:hypothetical protein
MDNLLLENITKISRTYQQEEEILSVQEIDAKLKLGHKDILCPTNQLVNVVQGSNRYLLCASEDTH